MQTRYIKGIGFGGPDQLVLADETLAPPEAGQILVRHEAIGVNFIDILQRRGDLGRDAPYRLGLEAAGEVVAVGEGVSGLSPGDRVVYAGGPMGAYAEMRLLPAARAVRLPDGIDARSAAAVFFKGLTADYLVHRMRPLSPGNGALVTAAAGGVGQLLAAMLKAAGVTVIGTVGQTAKVAAARAAGCDQVLVLDEIDSPGAAAAQIRDWKGGKGVAVAYDSIGRATFDLSLGALARFGLLVSYGWASGDVEPVAPARLREAGSVFLTRPTIGHYTEAREDLLAGAARVFRALQDGVIAARIDSELQLADAAEAQRRVEARETEGAVILTP